MGPKDLRVLGERLEKYYNNYKLWKDFFQDKGQGGNTPLLCYMPSFLLIPHFLDSS